MPGVSGATLALLLGFALVPAPVGAGADPAARCAAAKIKAAGRKYNGKAKCHAKAILRSEGVSAACLQRVEEKFLAAFAKADGMGTCAGSAAGVEADVDACMVDLVTEILPPSTTTTTPIPPSTTTTTTLGDVDPPGISSSQQVGATEVQIVFDELLQPSSVSPNGSNFALSNGAVLAATLQPDGMTVVLITSVLLPSTTYTVTVVGVTDLSGNAITAPDDETTFTTSP